MSHATQKAVKIVDKILGKQGKAAARKALRPDALLSAVIGNNAAASAEIDKKLWAYIKKNGLQDKHDKEFVNADKKLKPIFGGRNRVSLFEVSKLVGNHLKDETKS